MKELICVLDKQEIVVHHLISSGSVKFFSKRTRNFGLEFSNTTETDSTELLHVFYSDIFDRRKIDLLSSFADANSLTKISAHHDIQYSS